MKAILLLKHLSIANANAISGLTYGFPAPANFLGFTHALSRKLADKSNNAHGVKLGACAIICHQHQLQTQKIGYDSVFALSRNPLTKEGNTAPFNEEGRLHLTVSLLIECDFRAGALSFFGEALAKENKALFEQWICAQLPLLRVAGGTINHKCSEGDKEEALRVAGGTINACKNVCFIECDEDFEENQQQMRKVLRRLLPGFALVCRQDLLEKHHQECVAKNPQHAHLESLLDFVALRSKSTLQVGENSEKNENGENGENKGNWQNIAKPASGYFVPMNVGYEAISPLYEEGKVANARDQNVPFVFVESIYSLGQWISPHRIENIDALFWRHQKKGSLYLCFNEYHAFL